MVDDAEKIYEQALEIFVPGLQTTLTPYCNRHHQIPKDNYPKPPLKSKPYSGSLASNHNKAFGLWADESFDRTKYLEDLRKSYAEIGDKIRDAGDASDSILPGLKQQKQIIEEIARVMQIDLVLKKRAAAASRKHRKTLKSRLG